MSNLVDLWSETNPSLLSDDTTPALTLVNTVNLGPALRLAQRGGNNSGASIGIVQISVSGPSIPVLELQANAFVSAVSIIFAAGAGWAGMGGIRVKLSDGATYGWIPVLPNSQFTAAAI